MTAYCHRCGRTTTTMYLRLSSGHIGNLCVECRTARLGRPYVSWTEYEESQRTPKAAGQKVNHAHRDR